MKHLLTRKRITYHLILLAISAVLGLSYVQSISLPGSNICSSIGECESVQDHFEFKGTETTMSRGFPSVFSQHVQFVPDDTRRYAVASTTTVDAPLLAVTNVLFWWLLLNQLVVAYRRIVVKRAR